MGTGAVYVVLSGLKNRSPVVGLVETIFYFLNMVLFLLNTTTLVLQAIRMFQSMLSCMDDSHAFLLVYPRQAYRILTDPVKGIFVPLIVCSWLGPACQHDPQSSQVLSFATIVIGTINYAVPRHVGPNVIYALFWCVVKWEDPIGDAHRYIGSMLHSHY